MKFKVKKLSESAKIPAQAEIGAAGYDLYSDEDCVILPGERKLIQTNIAIEQSLGWYAKIEARSGLAYKNGIISMAGVIDSSYRNSWGVLLYNSGDKEFIVTKGMRIAQAIFLQHSSPRLEEVENLEESARGLDGFGSTGTH